MKQKNIKIVWLIIIVLVLVVVVSIITTSITGNVIKAKTSINGVETYTKDEIDVWMEDMQNDIDDLSENMGVASNTNSDTGETNTAENYQLECVTGYYDEIPGTGVGDTTFTSGIYTSSNDRTYAFTDVFSARIDYWGLLGATVLTCNSDQGWILTGCSGAEGDNNDEWMLNSNDCRADYGGWAWVSARCCKIISS